MASTALSRNAEPDLAARVRQLLARRRRLSLAAGFERAVHDAEHPARMFSSSVPVDREAIEGARGELLMLALELRSEGAVDARGVAMADRLLTLGDSPLYGPAAAGALRAAARAAREALCCI
jgi:hypothetical protein